MRKPNWTLPPTYRLSDHYGVGCFLEPPGHPSYFTRSIYTQYGNSPPYDRPQYEYREMYFTELEDINKLYKPLPLEHKRTQAWIAYLFGYFNNCYTDPSKPDNVRANTIIYPVSDYQLKHFVDDPRFSHEWREKEKSAIIQANEEITQWATKIATLDNHQATRFIRKYYPDFIPTLGMLKGDGYGRGTWWERLENKPTPEQCPGEDFREHPVNNTWCQVCGWRQKDS